MKLFSIIAAWALVATCSCAIPRLESKSNEGRVICYHGTWSYYRQGDGKFSVDDVDPFLCTHYIYSFAGLDPQTNKIKSLDPYLDLPESYGLNMFGKATGMRAVNKDLKVMLAIGGWNEGSTKYSNMAANKASRTVFINSVVDMLSKYKFDGLDVDWEYPAARGGAPQDKSNFVLLLEELRKEFDTRGWLLSVAVGMGKDKIDTSYDIPGVTRSVHFVNLMTYDFRGSWDGKTGHQTQLYVRPSDQGLSAYNNLNASVHLWLEKGAPSQKLNVGLASYGRTFTVPANNGPLDTPASGPGTAGQYTGEAGFLGYNEICEKIKSESWTVDTDSYVAAPWAYKGNQWVGYDDVASIETKSMWGKSLGLGGGMMWSIETDDFRGKCGDGKFPLLTKMNDIWRHGVTPNPHSTTTKGTTPKPNPTPTPAPPSTTSNPKNQCDEIGKIIADPDDCTQYLQCVQGAEGLYWMERPCPGGLAFNPDIGACDYMSNVDCS